MTAKHLFEVGDHVRITTGSCAGAEGRIIKILEDPKQGRHFITVRLKDSEKIQTASVYPDDLRRIEAR